MLLLHYLLYFKSFLECNILLLLLCRKMTRRIVKSRTKHPRAFILMAFSPFRINLLLKNTRELLCTSRAGQIVIISHNRRKEKNGTWRRALYFPYHGGAPPWTKVNRSKHSAARWQEWPNMIRLLKKSSLDRVWLSDWLICFHFVDDLESSKHSCSIHSLVQINKVYRPYKSVLSWVYIVVTLVVVEVLKQVRKGGIMRILKWNMSLGSTALKLYGCLLEGM